MISPLWPSCSGRSLERQDANADCSADAYRDAKSYSENAKQPFFASELVLPSDGSVPMRSAYLIQRCITRAQGRVTQVWTSLFLLYNYPFITSQA